MQKQDLQQIKQTLKEELKENNEKLKKDIVNEVGAITNQSFDEFGKKTGEKFNKMDQRFNKMDKRFDKMEKELEKKPNKSEISTWADNKIIPLQLDMDKAKYLHRQEWKKLPRAYEIKKTLIENGLA